MELSTESAVKGLFDQFVEVLAVAVAAKLAASAPQASGVTEKQVEGMIDKALDTYDPTSVYQFNDAVEDIVNNYDFSDKVEEAVNDLDLEDKIRDTVKELSFTVEVS